MESNDSPEIPDREEASDIPGLPSGVINTRFFKRYIKKNQKRNAQKQAKGDNHRYIAERINKTQIRPEELVGALSPVNHKGLHQG